MGKPIEEMTEDEYEIYKKYVQRPSEDDGKDYFKGM